MPKIFEKLEDFNAFRDEIVFKNLEKYVLEGYKKAFIKAIKNKDIQNARALLMESLIYLSNDIFSDGETRTECWMISEKSDNITVLSNIFFDIKFYNNKIIVEVSTEDI